MKVCCFEFVRVYACSNSLSFAPPPINEKSWQSLILGCQILQGNFSLQFFGHTLVGWCSFFPLGTKTRGSGDKVVFSNTHTHTHTICSNFLVATKNGVKFGDTLPGANFGGHVACAKSGANTRGGLLTRVLIEFGDTHATARDCLCFR